MDTTTQPTPIGPGGPSFGPIALGCMFFGTRVPEPDAFAILDRYVERGGTVIDTADNYAFWVPGATGDESELVVGRWLQACGRRDEIVLTTKLGARPRVPGGGLEDAEGLGRAAVADGLQASLRRLQTDRVDLLLAHVDDRRTPLDESVSALGGLVADGRAGAIGASNIRAWRLALALEASARAGLPAYCCVQQRLSYLQPDPSADLGVQVAVDEDLVDLCAHAGLGIVAYSPLLSGAYTRSDVPLAPGYRTADNARRGAALARVARDAGATPNQVVLAWLRQARGVRVVPLVGASSVAQLDESLDAAELRLDEGQLAELRDAALGDPAGTPAQLGSS